MASNSSSDAHLVLAQLHGDAIGLLLDIRDMRQCADFRDSSGEGFASWTCTVRRRLSAR